MMIQDRERARAETRKAKDTAVSTEKIEGEKAREDKERKHAQFGYKADSTPSPQTAVVAKTSR